jgi:ubiquinone/menaquinone biosynthesis C-methylase UbiE
LLVKKPLMAQIWECETSNWKHRNEARQAFIQKAKSYSGNFLEIGPGYGRVMLEIEQHNSIIGLEMDDKLVELLKNRQLKVIKGIAEAIPFENDSFDVVLCEEVIEHIKMQSSVINEVHRVLKSHGVAVFTTPNKYIYRTLMWINNLRRLDFKIPIYKNPTPGHISELTSKGFRNLFKEKFDIIDFIPLNSYLPKTILKKIPFLAINNLIVARKP